jgi:hypothetical protein
MHACKVPMSQVKHTQGGIGGRPNVIHADLVNSAHLSLLTEAQCEESIPGKEDPPMSGLLHELAERYGKREFFIIFQVRADEDLLAEDDAVLHAIRAEGEVSVLMVDGNLTPEPLHNESDLARYALNPPPLGKVKNLPYTVKVVSPVELYRMRQLRRKYAAILFMNVREPDEALVNRLEQYVARGGLLMALGDRVGKAYYNEFLYREGRGLLPCEIFAKGGDEAVEEKFQVPTIAMPHHPAMATLGLDEAGFENVHVRAWLRVKVPRFLSETHAVLRLSPGGDPLLLARRFGRGMLFVVTTGLNAKWSDFPIHPSYQLLMRGLVDSLRASQQVALNLKVGAELRATFTFERWRRFPVHRVSIAAFSRTSRRDATP